MSKQISELDKPLLPPGGSAPSLFFDLSRASLLKYLKAEEDPESLRPHDNAAMIHEATEEMRKFYGEDEGGAPHLNAAVQSNLEEPDQVTLTAEELKKPFPEDGKGGRASRHKPKPSVPQPIPDDLKFMFSRLEEEQVNYLWGLYKRLFVVECLWVILYPTVLLKQLDYWPATLIFGFTFWWMMIQNLYMLHDSIHIAPFPPQPWMKFMTHCWADIIGLCWEDIVLEHSRHHASTPDILIHGEFGWDPAEWLYVLQDKSWWTVPLVPVWHFLGANDTGILFMFHWYTQFPNEKAIEQCLRPRSGPDVAKINSRRFISAFWQLCLWGCVWLLGTAPMDRPMNEGWKLVLTVNFFSRLGWATAWMFFANINHSLAWNQYLAEGKDRQNWIADYFLTFALGGRARVNELKFHDLHHAFPNKVGAMSMRGRFFGADKVYDGAMRLLEHGLYEVVADGAPNGMAMKMQASVMQQKKMDEGGALIVVDASDMDRKLVKAQDPLINKLQRQRSYMYRKKA